MGKSWEKRNHPLDHDASGDEEMCPLPGVASCPCPGSGKLRETGLDGELFRRASKEAGRGVGSLSLAPPGAGLLGSLGRDVRYQGLFSPWGSSGDAEVAAAGALRTGPGLGAA